MRTDIILEHQARGRRIVIDTKFTSILVGGWYREQSLRSGYIYQMYAYLRSQVGHGEHLADCAEGVLLHPAVGQSLDECVVMHGQRIRFATLDLTATTSAIRASLMRICDLVQLLRDDLTLRPTPPARISGCSWYWRSQSIRTLTTDGSLAIEP